MVNITMLVHNRLALTSQSILSLRLNTPRKMYDLTVLDDSSELATAKYLESHVSSYDGLDLLVSNKQSNGTGAARNKVIECAVKNKRQYLYLSDNDVFFKPNWLHILIEAYEYSRSKFNVIALGAYNHPYHIPFNVKPFYSNGHMFQIGEVQALSLQSWLWRWEDWYKYGPFHTTEPGTVRMGEDVDMGNRIRSDGGKLATMIPSLIYNTSRTDSFGKLVPGYELIPNNIPGVIVE